MIGWIVVIGAMLFVAWGVWQIYKESQGGDFE